MASFTHGRCPTCRAIWRWPSAGGPRVTKGEALCPNDGDTLERTAASLVRDTPIRDGVAVFKRRKATAISCNTILDERMIEDGCYER